MMFAKMRLQRYCFSFILANKLQGKIKKKELNLFLFRAFCCGE